MSQMLKRKSEDQPNGEEEEHESMRQKVDENAVDEDDMYAPQHEKVFGDSERKVANGSRARWHKSEEEKRRIRLAANRSSARESRNRKKVVLEELQRSVGRLIEENDALRAENAAFRKQVEEFKRKYCVAKEGDGNLAGTGNESAARADGIGAPDDDVDSQSMPSILPLPQQAPDLSLSLGSSSVSGAPDLAGAQGIPAHGTPGNSQNQQTLQPAPGMGTSLSEASSAASPNQDYRSISYDQLKRLAAAQQQWQYAQQAATFPGMPSNFAGQDIPGQNDMATPAQLQHQQQAQQHQNQQKQQQDTQATQMLLELLKMQHAALLKQQQQQQQQQSQGS